MSLFEQVYLQIEDLCDELIRHLKEVDIFILSRTNYDLHFAFHGEQLGKKKDHLRAMRMMPNKKRLLRYFMKGSENFVCGLAIETNDLSLLKILAQRNHHFKPRYYNYLFEEIDNLGDLDKEYLQKKIKCMKFANQKLDYPLGFISLNVAYYELMFGPALANWFRSDPNYVEKKGMLERIKH